MSSDLSTFHCLNDRRFLLKYGVSIDTSALDTFAKSGEVVIEIFCPSCKIAYQLFFDSTGLKRIIPKEKDKKEVKDAKILDIAASGAVASEH